MSLPVLALFNRSLRLESRLLRTYLKRLGLLLIILLALFQLHVSEWRVSAAGLEFFEMVVYINFFFITLTALGYFSSAITEEKEDQTLGLLKMSSLNPLAILLGKSTSRLAGVLMLLLVQFPFTLLAITLGGVSLTQIVAAYATLIAYLFLLCNLALFCSVFSKRSRNASMAAGLLLFLFLLSALVEDMVLIHAGAMGWIDKDGWLYAVLMLLAQSLRRANPIWQITQIMATGFQGPVVGFQVLSDLGIGLVFFLLSWATFELFTREQKESSPARGAVFRRVSPLRWLGVGRPWPVPLAWKDFHFLCGGRTVMATKLLLLALLPLGINWYCRVAIGKHPTTEEMGAALMIFMLILAGIEVVVHASRVLQDEIRWRTLAGIATLPLSVYELVYHKLAGFVLALVPYLVFFLIGLSMNPEGFAEGAEEFLSSEEGWLTLLNFVAFAHFVAFLSTIFKHAGTAVALGTWTLGMLFALIFAQAMRLDLETLAIPACFGLAVFTLVVHIATLRRLERLAGAQE